MSQSDHLNLILIATKEVANENKIIKSATINIKKIADNTSKSDFILLFGEIGSGKTTFARNFINYLQEKENSEKN